MIRKQRRQYEMLLRLRDFAKAHAQVFSQNGAGQEAFAAIDSAVNELTATDLVKMAASASARTTRLTARRKALTDLLAQMSQLARVLRARGHNLPAFEIPVSKSDQSLLTAARQFARDAAGFEAEFSRHAMGSKAIADVAAAFETATRDRGMSRAEHVAATARIRDLLAAAMLDVRRLDLIVNRELAGDNVVRAVWKQARRVGKVTTRAAAPESSETSEESEAVEASEPAEAPEEPEATETPAAGALT